MSSFPERVGPRILSLESVDYFGTSEYFSCREKEESLWAKLRCWGVGNFHCMQMSLVMVMRFISGEFWVLRFRSWMLRFRVLGASFSSFGCFVLRSSFSSASFSKLPKWQAIFITFLHCNFSRIEALDFRVFIRADWNNSETNRPIRYKIKTSISWEILYRR